MQRTTDIKIRLSLSITTTIVKKKYTSIVLHVNDHLHNVHYTVDKASSYKTIFVRVEVYNTYNTEISRALPHQSLHP